MTTARYRAIWLSDTHLGTRECRAEMPLDFLDRHEADYRAPDQIPRLPFARREVEATVTSS